MVSAYLEMQELCCCFEVACAVPFIVILLTLAVNGGLGEIYTKKDHGFSMIFTWGCSVHVPNISQQSFETVVEQV